MQFFLADEIELGLQLAVGHKDGAVCFIVDRIDKIFGRALFLSYQYIARIKWSSATLRQWHQLTVQVNAKQMEE